ncbi:hypothetical protein RLEG12_07960 (plasmid) [Rhizobium leguminosarum bv. trifolii CB782]|nr:hypothetical protein RLEG12_07960 [Rhizobium leguminosarum bv. trifolii CB782]
MFLAAVQIHSDTILTNQSAERGAYAFKTIVAARSPIPSQVLSGGEYDLRLKPSTHAVFEEDRSAHLMSQLLRDCETSS